jgi:hypothetical protein
MLGQRLYGEADDAEKNSAIIVIRFLFSWFPYDFMNKNRQWFSFYFLERTIIVESLIISGFIQDDLHGRTFVFTPMSCITTPKNADFVRTLYENFRKIW